MDHFAQPKACKLVYYFAYGDQPTDRAMGWRVCSHTQGFFVLPAPGQPIHWRESGHDVPACLADDIRRLGAFGAGTAYSAAKDGNLAAYIARKETTTAQLGVDQAFAAQHQAIGRPRKPLPQAPGARSPPEQEALVDLAEGSGGDRMAIDEDDKAIREAGPSHAGRPILPSFSGYRPFAGVGQGNGRVVQPLAGPFVAPAAVPAAAAAVAGPASAPDPAVAPGGASAIASAVASAVASAIVPGVAPLVFVVQMASAAPGALLAPAAFPASFVLPAPVVPAVPAVPGFLGAPVSPAPAPAAPVPRPGAGPDWQDAEQIRLVRLWDLVEKRNLDMRRKVVHK
ncbi:hypothetical protein B0H67DRAFT_612536, partial [Lasiosphaeris hirsuta]